jgi:excinuclease UvrABC nuclease subunit
LPATLYQLNYLVKTPNRQTKKDIDMTATTKWLSHVFTVYQHDGQNQWNNLPGIYIFAGTNQQDRLIPYYIGQCDSFLNRIPSHEQWDMAKAFGATHVHVMVVPLASNRDSIEQELIQKYQPVLNVQLR